jgi:hypothetical protein
MLRQMSSDLIAWVVAITLGVAVVGLGLRRNLGDTTRTWLPRFGEGSARTTATSGSLDGERRRRPLSPRQRRWMVGGYLLLSLCNAALALPWAKDRLLHAIIAALFALCAVGVWRKKLPLSVNWSIS